jgi:uncharacterized protein YabN with tetrapyrrole methylase and pyrophosphatase domain
MRRGNLNHCNYIGEVLEVVAKLRAPDGCPWDRKQTHQSIWGHLVEEVYELRDAIKSGDDKALIEELGDVLLHVVFHCQIASERGAFTFDDVCKHLVEKLVRRHPHVFGDLKVAHVEDVLKNWEKIKMAEKEGTPQERRSVFDGVPNHLPALMKAQKLIKRAAKLALLDESNDDKDIGSESELGRRLFELVSLAVKHGWSAEEALLEEVASRERAWRKAELESRTSARKLAKASTKKSSTAKA